VFSGFPKGDQMTKTTLLDTTALVGAPTTAPSECPSTVPFEDAAREGKQIIAAWEAGQMRLGELADLVEPKYGEATLKKLAEAWGKADCTPERWRNVWRNWKDAPGPVLDIARVHYTVARELQTHPDRFDLIRADMTKREAVDLMRAWRAKSPETEAEETQPEETIEPEEPEETDEPDELKPEEADAEPDEAEPQADPVEVDRRTHHERWLGALYRVANDFIRVARIDTQYVDEALLREVILEQSGLWPTIEEACNIFTATKAYLERLRQDEAPAEAAE
jgi:hypothetical protein